MKKALILFLTVVLLIGGVLGGCTNNPDAPKASEPAAGAPNAGSSDTATGDASASTPSKSGQTTITVGVTQDILSFDPHGYTGIASTIPGRHIYDTLVRIMPDDSLEPCLAESWEVLDETTIQFKLRQDVKYHNGEPFSAHDVKFSIERHLGTTFTLSMVSAIDHVEVIDDYTCNVILNTPASSMTLTNLAYPTCGIVSKKTVEELEAAGKTLDENPIGTGPLKFVSFMSGDNVVLARNDEYWGVPAAHEKMILRIITDDSARSIALETGEVDILLEVPSSEFDRIRGNQDLVLEEYASSKMEFAYLNTTKAPLDNKLVRQALSHLVQRDAVIAIAENGNGLPLYSPIAEGHRYYMPEVTQYEYDVEKAKALLAEAGYPDGFDLSLVCISQNRARIGQVLQADFEKAGINLKVETIENSAFLDMTKNNEHQIALSSWTSSVDPNATFPSLFSNGPLGTANNRSRYNNPAIEPMLEKGRAGRDFEERYNIYKEVQKILMDDVAIIPFYTAMGAVARHSDLKGLQLYPSVQHRLDQLHY